MGYEQQVIDNAAAIQAILDAGKTIDQLPEGLDPVQPADVVAVRVNASGETVKKSVADLQNMVWIEIEGSEVKKTGGVSLTTLEAGDTVRFKPITNNGFPVTIPYGVYDGGDKQDSDNYTLPTLLT